MKTITCRTHGGTFQITPKRGRPPVKCGDPYPVCTLADRGTRRERIQRTPLAVEKPAKAQREEQTIRAAVKRAAARAASALESPVEAPTASNLSVPLAMTARDMLEAQGWACTARAIGAQGVEMQASRGTERMVVVWEAGEVVSQQYSLWDTEKPSANGKPADRTKLPFDPDEMTDKELIQTLSGMRVIWWNRIAQGEESATIPSKAQIVHTYNGIGDETPADRVITFVDAHGSGFRSFRVGALMRIGK